MKRKIPVPLDKFMGVVDRARGQLPPFLDSYLPASAAEFRVAIGDWASKHLADLQLVGKDAAHMFVTLLIGMVLGAIIALQRIPDVTKRKPLAAALFDRLHLLVQAFRNIVFAQIKISLLNTFFTAIFLAVILPVRHQAAVDQDPDRPDLPARPAAGDR